MSNKLIKQMVGDDWIPQHGYLTHPIHEEYRACDKRFICVAAGRRSSKSFQTKRKVVLYALKNPNKMIFVCGPTFGQIRSIWFLSLQKMLPKFMVAKISYSDLTIFLKNGTTIKMMSLEKPERAEGQDVSLVVIDEASDVKEGVFENNIYPGLSTYGLDAQCWMVSTPGGLSNWFSQLFLHYRDGHDADWACFHWTSSTILSTEELEKAKKRLPPDLYKQEYEADFISSSALVYTDYTENNYTNRIIDPDEPIILTTDFNLSPMSTAIIQNEGYGLNTKSYVVDEIVLKGATAKHTALEFVERYKNHKKKFVKIYGDSQGHNSDKWGIDSEYQILDTILRRSGWVVEIKAARAHQSLKDSQNSLKARLLNASNENHFFVNREKCPYCHKGLSTLEYKDGSTFLEDETEYQHITTALRYFTEIEWPVNRDNFTSSTFMIR